MGEQREEVVAGVDPRIARHELERAQEQLDRYRRALLVIRGAAFSRRNMGQSWRNVLQICNEVLA